MGLPHRDIPFFYFNRYGQNSTYYGGSFTDIVPKDPGREYSKVPSCFEVISPIKIGSLNMASSIDIVTTRVGANF